MCRSTHVSDEFSFPFTFGAATVRCFTSNLIQPLLWPSVTLATLSGLAEKCGWRWDRDRTNL
jgi:hypothetical protein